MTSTADRRLQRGTSNMSMTDQPALSGYLNHPIRLNTGKTVPREAVIAAVRRWVAAGGDDTATWDQDTYGRKDACGTACCVAGWVALAVNAPHKVIGWNGSFRYDEVRQQAADALGLDFFESGRLFNGNNKQADVLRILDSLLAEGPRR